MSDFRTTLTGLSEAFGSLADAMEEVNEQTRAIIEAADALAEAYDAWEAACDADETETKSSSPTIHAWERMHQARAAYRRTRGAP